MKTTRYPILLLLLTSLFAAACDTSEDPRLLNPEAADSTHFRVVNLTDGQLVNVNIGGQIVASEVQTGQTSEYRKLLFLDRVPMFVTTGSKIDTIRDQRMNAGARMTMFVFGGGTMTRIVIRESSTLEQSDLLAANLGRLTFINGVNDAGGRLVKRGCQSGDTLFPTVPFGGSYTYESQGTELSLFMGSPTIPLTRSGRYVLEAGKVAWIVASRTAGEDRLHVIRPEDSQLRELEAETRTEAQVEVFNALAAGATIDARIGETPVASGLSALSTSLPAGVEACRSVMGDSLEITPNGGSPLTVVLRLEVASRALAVVFGNDSRVRALTLRTDPPAVRPGTAALRVVHVSTSVDAAQVIFGDGAPPPLTGALHPLIQSTYGSATNWLSLRPGDYPLMLQSASTGRYLAGGIESLAEGYHTLFIVDNDGSPALMMLSHNDGPSVIEPIANAGTRARLFNLAPELLASFTAGAMRLDSVPYNYVLTSVVPFNASQVETTAGTVAADHGTGVMIVGTTGTPDARLALAVPGSATKPAAEHALLRVLNAVPGSSELETQIGADDKLVSAYGVPSAGVDLNEGKYSLTIRQPGGTETLAQVSGIELLESRCYLVIIGPHPSGTDGARYRVLMVQE